MPIGARDRITGRQITDTPQAYQLRGVVKEVQMQEDTALQMKEDTTPLTTLLGRIPLFASLEPAHLEELAGKLTLRKYDPGTRIFMQDDPGSTLFVIRNGQVNISAPSPKGGEAILAVMTDGDFFGELSILDQKPRSATATAMRPTTVFTLERDDFLEVVHTEPYLAINALAALSERLRRTNLLLGDAFFTDLPTRLAKRLLELARRHGVETDHGLKIDLRLTQADLISEMGASRESVKRLLEELQDQGLILVAGKNIYVRRLDMLRRLTLEGLLQVPKHRFERGRQENGLLALLFGIGVLVFALGAATELMTTGQGFVGWVAAWVIAVALWAYWKYEEARGFEAEL
jgi:CRP-like cAMP-binding protein